MEEFEQSSWLESWLLSARERIEDLEALLETALVICGEPGGLISMNRRSFLIFENFQKLKGAASYREHLYGDPFHGKMGQTFVQKG